MHTIAYINPFTDGKNKYMSEKSTEKCYGCQQAKQERGRANQKDNAATEEFEEVRKVK